MRASFFAHAKNHYSWIRVNMAVGHASYGFTCSGEIWGKGFMQGTQTQLHFLPARHTDFIFSVIAEEQGFFLCSIIFILFYLLAATGLNIATQSQDPFKMLTAVEDVSEPEDGGLGRTHP